MARGMPAFWSALLGLPMAGLGVWLFQFQEKYPPEAGAPFILFGVFIIGVGAYIQFIASPDPPTMREGEEIIDTRNPAQRASMVAIVVSIPVLGAGIYLLYFTTSPYIYPTVAFFGGLYLFSKGLHTYWTNTLTTYYLTNQRVIEEYRFLSLLRSELTFDKVRGVEERKSAFESMVGLGNVVVRAGGGDLEVAVRNIYDSTEFADQVRELL